MTRYVALLRGVNVGGHRKVPMAALRSALTDAGAADVRTYLQSGNAVLDSPLPPGGVADLVRSAVRASSGVDTDVVVRTQAEMAGVVTRNPWPERTASPALLHVLFLSAEPTSVRVDRVGEQEQVQPDGREVWVWYGDGSGRSKLRIEAPGVVVTARNWTTVTALAGL